MGFRYRKSIRLGKGVKLNLGRKSAGISFGRRRGGVSINSRTGTRARVSIPGTGISYSTKLSGGKKRRASSYRPTGAKAASVGQITSTQAQKLNPKKPPKSPKVYRVCGAIVVPIGILMLFTCWPLGLFFAGFGTYYIVCGPKIYADLVAKYKAVYPDYEENS